MNLPKAKYILIIVFIISWHYQLFAQQKTTISAINLWVNQVNNTKSIAQYEFASVTFDSAGTISGSGLTYTFIYDTVERKLLKVVVKDPRYIETKDYYFLNDRLLCIKQGSGVNYFLEMDFSIGTIWKSENDPGLLTREREIATAYRFLLNYKQKDEIYHNLK